MNQPMKRYCCTDREAMEPEAGYPPQVTRWIKAADVEALEARVKELVDVIIDAKMERLLTHLGIRKP